MAETVRILFAGGGTGGHLYPGLAVAEQLLLLVPDVEIRWLATQRQIDRHVLGGEPYQAEFVDARGFSRWPWSWPAFVIKLLANMGRARDYLREFRPHAVIGLGGFGSYAAMRQAQALELPNFIMNPDLLFGRANCRLARKATVVFCQFPETVGQVTCGGRIEVLGCPVRASLFGVGRGAACEALKLDAARKTLLVTGASSGAKTINQVFMQLAGRLERFSDWQVLHLTGRAAYDEVRRAVGEARPNYRVLDYEDDMGRVYAATDLVVARAGAGTVAELTALGLASVLMPYPFHRDRHQERHAQLLERAGAAVMVRDRVKTYGNVDALWRVLPQLLEDDERRRAMAEAARKLGQPKAAKAIAQAVLRAIGW